MNKTVFAAFAAAAILYAGAARAETTECTEITSIPMVITVQGVYCFKQNLGTNITTGNAIDIQTNNVTIDFNGFKLGGLAAGPSTGAYGVYAADRQNITLKNGNIRGFYHGIYLEQSGGTSSGHVIEDSLFDANTVFAMRVEGSGIVVRNNHMVNTDSTPPAAESSFGNASRLTAGAAPDIAHGVEPMAGTGTIAYGINGSLTDSLITGNFISRTISSGINAYGMALFESDNVEVAGNTVVNIIAEDRASGIYLHTSNNIFIRNNTLIDGKSSSSDAHGIYAAVLTTNIICQDNRITDFADGQTSGCDFETGTYP